MQLLAAALAFLLQDAPVAYRGARVYPGQGPALDDAVVVVVGTKIQAVGKGAAVPPEARVVDLSGKVVVPGFIDAGARLWTPADERGPGGADQSVLDGLDRYLDDGREARERGITAAFLLPPGAGPVCGRGAVVRLDDARSVLEPDAGLRISLSAGELSTPAMRHESLQQLRQLIDSAKAYGEALEKFRKDHAEWTEKKRTAEGTKAPEPQKPKTDLRQAAVLRLLSPKDPAILRAEVHAADSIAEILRIAEQHKLRLVLEGASGAAPAAAVLAKAGVAVVAGPPLRYGPAGPDHRGDPSTLAARLAAGGVRVALGSFPSETGEGGCPSRFLAEWAALCCAGGLTREQALSMITLEAARILGVEKSIGSLEAGKLADFVVLSGDPFQPGTVVERVIVGGVEAKR
jgi:imidazolonepropionase-like amidohydrolase